MKKQLSKTPINTYKTKQQINSIYQLTKRKIKTQQQHQKYLPKHKKSTKKLIVAQQPKN